MSRNIFETYIRSLFCQNDVFDPEKRIFILSYFYFILIFYIF
uniref:Uncharacterized protein n=1 Tax=Siphoviridae sp. ctCUc43 TaxID=2825379 RepID=A0A8S5QJI8_9CAUD|nr:MAG TPA: hypothetical protein [Siphoviridae sp. ctCUc43]